MKRILLLSSVLAIFFSSCYEEIVYDENPFLNKRQEFRFSELKLLQPVVSLNSEAEIQAIASGDSLNFYWSAPEGNLVVDNNIAFFHHDTEGYYTVICQIRDKYGESETREVNIHVTPEMVFTGMVAEVDTIPQDYQIFIEATASGEEITYEWNSTGGILEGENAKVFFKSSAPGTYTISCTVTDLAGVSETIEIEITVVEGFIFRELKADPERIRAHDNSYLTATALGNNLSYNWSCDPPAVLLGEGPNIIFNICHADVFTVTCIITDDKGNSQSKSVKITVTDL